METNYVLCITFYHTVVKMSRYAEADFSVFRLKNVFSDGYNIRFFHKKQHQPFAVIEINYERIINPPRYLFVSFSYISSCLSAKNSAVRALIYLIKNDIIPSYRVAKA